MNSYRGNSCERNGCEMLATTLVYFHQYSEPTQCCERHARWYKENTIATRLEPMGPMSLEGAANTIEEVALRNS